MNWPPTSGCTNSAAAMASAALVPEIASPAA